MSLYSAFVMICKRTAGMIPSIILPLPRFDIRSISRAIALLTGHVRRRERGTINIDLRRYVSLTLDVSCVGVRGRLLVQLR
jgi:hypothetical protein